jgi:hypothetical protein
LFAGGEEGFDFSLITLKHTLHSVGLLWTRDRPEKEEHFAKSYITFIRTLWGLKLVPVINSFINRRNFFEMEIMSLISSSANPSGRAV